MTDRKIKVEMSEDDYNKFMGRKWKSIYCDAHGVSWNDVVCLTPSDIKNVVADSVHRRIKERRDEGLKLVSEANDLQCRVDEFAALLAKGDEPEPQSPLEVIPDGYRVLSADEIMQDGDELNWLEELEPINPGYFGKQAKMFMPGAVVIRKKPEPTAEPAPKSTKPEDNIPEGWERIDNDLPSVSEKWWNYFYKKFEDGPCETSRQFVIRESKSEEAAK